MTDNVITTNSTDQDDVLGYLTRQDATIVASVYFMTAQALAALGDRQRANWYEGYGFGLEVGAS